MEEKLYKVRINYWIKGLDKKLFKQMHLVKATSEYGVEVKIRSHYKGKGAEEGCVYDLEIYCINVVIF